MDALTVPFWGMEDAPGKVVAWLVPEGSPVSRGQEVVEIETSKLVNAVESPFDGILVRHVLAVGESAPGGSLLGVVAKEAPPADVLEAFVQENAAVKAEDGRVLPVELSLETSAGPVSAIYRKGDGPTVVLLHGFGADAKSWQPFMEQLDSSYELLIADLPGHGNSFMGLGDTPIDAILSAVVEAVRKQSEGPVHLVGHSFGGLLALRWALEHGNVASLSLLAPAGLGATVNTTFLDSFAAADSRKAARSALEMVVRDPSSVNLTAVNDLLRARRLDGAIAALQGLRTALADEGGNQKTDLRPQLAALDLPKLVVWGTEDAIVPAPEALDGVSIVSINDGGHLIQVENAGEVAEKVKAHVGSVS